MKSEKRKDAAAIYEEQNRPDLMQDELDQVAVLEAFLPEQMSEEEITNVVVSVITDLGAQSMSDMGKVMGKVNGMLAGKADGKVIATIVRQKLS